MSCGLAGKYWQLAIARMGVGVGEATLSPSAYSLITDYFRPNRLAMAISFYGAGIYIGSGLAYLLGGIVVGFASSGDMMSVPFVGEVRPWQFVFFVIGFPGLLFTPMLFTIREPIRRGLKKAQAGQEAAASVPLKEVFTYVRANWRTFFYHNVGFALCSFISYGSASWLPTFFIRIHDFNRAQIGIWYGSIVIIFGTAGIIFGGYFAGKLDRKSVV